MTGAGGILAMLSQTRILEVMAESMGAGGAELDAGFAYGLAFACALDDVREIDRVRRGGHLTDIRSLLSSRFLFLRP